MTIATKLTAAAVALALTSAPALAQVDTVQVGGKAFTEHLVISEMTRVLLEDRGYDVDLRTGMGSTVLREAQVEGQIDLYWEYTGTSLVVYNERSGTGVSPEESLATVRELDGELGLVWLEPSGINNTYAIAMRDAHAEELGITTLSDLSDAVNDGEEIVFASNAEFYERDDGLRPLQEAYGFEFGRANIRRMATGLIYDAVRDDEADTGVVFSTDGRVAAFDLRILEDDLGYFPAYQLTPVIRADVLEADPQLGVIMGEMAASLDDPTITALNAAVDIDGRDIEDVVTEHLVSAGLIEG